MKIQGTQNKRSLKKNYIVGFVLRHFKTYYKATIIKTAQYWSKDRYTDPQNRLESPKIEPQLYGQLIFNKSAKVLNGEKIVFSTKGVGTTGYSYTFFHTYTKP